MEISIREFTGGKVEVEVLGQKLSSKQKSSGVGRTTFLFEDFVVKFSRGSNQNQNEINFYEKHLQPTDAHYFPKLLGYGTFNDGTRELSFIIQERVYDTVLFEEETHGVDLKHIEKKYGFEDYYYSTRSIGQNENIAVTKDGLKVYDMGFYHIPK